GGDFTSATNANGVATNASRVAKWDGTNWSALAGGVSATVRALAVSGTDLYVGGDFTSATNANGVATNASRVAKWDGTNWSAPAGGVNSKVIALAVSGTNLYVGGAFGSVTNGATRLPASSLAKLNLTTGQWSVYGGLDNQVNALALAGSTLYAGGLFTAATNGASAVSAYRIARLDLTTEQWSALGGGVNNTVTALAVSGADLFAGGIFSSVTNAEYSPLAASCIAKWDGTTWSALGSGADNVVRALAASDTDLYVGGDFTTAGRKICAYVAKAALVLAEPTTNTLASSRNPSTCGASVTFTSTVSPSAATGLVTFKDGATTLGTGTLSAGSATFVTNGLTAGSHSLTAEYAGDAIYAASISGVLTQTVNKLIPSVTWPTASAITYGQTLASSTLTGGASTPEGSFAFTTPATAPGAGTALQAVTFTPTDTTNYASVSDAVSVAVNPLPAVLTGSRLYDGTADAVFSILTVSNALAGDTVTLVSGTATLAAAFPGARALTSAGTLVLGGARGTNYTLTGASGLVTITSAPPNILLQPAGGVVAIDQSNGVSVTVTGTLPGYQWFKDGVLLVGQTNSSVSFASFQFTDSGSYRVVVTNALGLVLSLPALLSVPNAPLQAWGYNEFGQLGNGTTSSTNLPASVTSNVVAVAAGYAHSLLVKADGTLWGMGYNSNGQLGNGSTSDTNRPVSVTSNVVAVAAGYAHSLFVKADGTLWGMGYNSNGQLGNGSTTDTNQPVIVASNVVAVAAGDSHSLFVKADGTLWAMGYNSYGQLGDGSNSDTKRPVSVASNVVAVAAGFMHSLFVKTDGTLWGMGYNSNGQLGNGSTTDTNQPVIVASNVVAVAAGDSHSLFVKADGTLWAMGYNNFGQFGNGANAQINTLPVSVASNVVAVAAGRLHSLFVKADGTLWAMGRNAAGQLGNGSNSDTNRPVNVVGFSVASLGAMDMASHSLAVAAVLKSPATVTLT
ncbi:MAG: Ig-like domain repeat protein, partial [Verrucomicrobiota bacterium]